MFGKTSIPLHKWKRVPTGTDEDDEAGETFIAKETVPFKQESNRISKIALATLTILNFTVFAATMFMVRHPQLAFSYGRNHALKQTSYWSRVLEEIEIPTYVDMINGTFFASDPLSIARMDPGPATDKAWAPYDKSGTYIATREQIIKLGKDPDTVAKFDDEYWGFGDDAYMVQLDVFHQIHCLNLLRMSAFSNYPGYTRKIPAYGETEAIKWTHLGHCLDILLQNLKCNANTDLLTLTWIEGRETLFPDFSINHQCRDFEAVERWHEANRVDQAKLDRMPIPKKTFRWPSPWLHPESELGHKLNQEHQQEGRPRPKLPPKTEEEEQEEEHVHGHGHP